MSMGQTACTRVKLTAETVAVWVGSLARQASRQGGRAVGVREGG